jgi:putative transposase
MGENVLPDRLIHYQPGFFYLTCETIGRESVILGSVLQHLLRNVLNQVKQRCPFQTQAFVLLPDHLHLLLRPETAATVDEIVQALFTRFEHDYAEMRGQPKVETIWQRGHRLQRVKAESEFLERMDWIHYNPVFHQWVTTPEAWPYSSYQSWVERGWYGAQWGWTEPESIQQGRRRRWG